MTVVLVENALVERAFDRTPVHRPVVRGGARRQVDDLLAAPGHPQTSGVGDGADDGGGHVPLRTDREEVVELLGGDHGHHAFLRLAHEDLLGSERRVAQRYGVEVDVHAAGAGSREFGRRAREAGRAEVLDADDEVGGEDLEAALDEHLLGERVADLDGGTLGRFRVVERRAGEHRRPADSVAAGARAEQHDLVPGTVGLGQLDAVGAHHSDAQRVDQRVAGVALVEVDLAADVRQAEAVAVAADARDDTGQHSRGVGRGDLAEAQRVHDRDRASAHGQDVAHDAADARRGALVRLDIGRVVVRLDLEGDRPALTRVDHTRVLAHADKQRVGLRCLLAELLQVHFGRLVRAVLAPHHAVDRELGTGRAPAEDLADLQVLLVGQAEFLRRLRLLRSRLRVLDGVGHGLASQQGVSRRVALLTGQDGSCGDSDSRLRKKPMPSVPVPVSGSMACSGCGISPTTVPASFVTPAMSR